MESLTIENVSKASEEQRDAIAATIRATIIEFNLHRVSAAQIEPLVLAVKEDSLLVGGLVGRIAWDWLYIEILWLAESIRRKNIGTKLILEAEAIAHDHACLGIYLDTFSFQAPGFYQRLGYEVFGKLDNQPQGHSRYFLKKNLR